MISLEDLLFYKGASEVSFFVFRREVLEEAVRLAVDAFREHVLETLLDPELFDAVRRYRYR